MVQAGAPQGRKTSLVSRRGPTKILSSLPLARPRGAQGMKALVTWGGGLSSGAGPTAMLMLGRF